MKKLTDSSRLQKILGLPPGESPLIQLALVHSSFINENPQIGLQSNEKIEFLGDAVLGLIMAEKLYHDFPLFSEGDLTVLRSALVRQESLAQLARKIQLGDFLLLGKGEETGGGREKPLNLAGAFEAIVAAIYLEFGLEKARRFVLEQFGEEILDKARQGAGADFKSRLQEFSQAEWQVTPVYKVLEASGPDHDRLFRVEVRASDKVLGEGSGKSKKSAEMQAARNALEGLGIDE